MRLVTRRRVRAVVAALALAFAATATSLVTGASPADAAQPVVAGSCATTVQGQPGQPVALDPRAVIEPVTDIVRAVPLLGPTLAEPFRAAFAAQAPIPIGTVQPENTTIRGATIANAVVASLQQIPLLGPVLSTVVGAVGQTLSASCAVVVHVINAAAAPVQDGAKAVTDAIGGGSRPQPPGATPETPPGAPAGQPGPGSPQNVTGPNHSVIGDGLPIVGPILSGMGGFDFGRSPMVDYSSIPFTQAGLFAPAPGVRYGGSVPGYRPQFGVLGTDTPPDSGVRTAGHAVALPSHPSNGIGVPLPVLLAIFVLSGVMAALVRTWVVRRG